jgi:hypothetical protein
MDVIAAPLAQFLESDIEELRLVICMLISYPIILFFCVFYDEMVQKILHKMVLAIASVKSYIPFIAIASFPLEI